MLHYSCRKLVCFYVYLRILSHQPPKSLRSFSVFLIKLRIVGFEVSVEGGGDEVLLNIRQVKVVAGKVQSQEDRS
jgi:hypothetical protein